MLDKIAPKCIIENSIYFELKQLIKAYLMNEKIMKIELYDDGNISVISVAGLLDSNTAVEFGKATQSILEQGKKTILVDMSQLEYISSAGLREFHGLFKAIKKVSGKLALCSLQDDVFEVFSIAGLEGIFNLFESYDLAVVSLRSS